jgi:hypothetical protein
MDRYPLSQRKSVIPSGLRQRFRRLCRLLSRFLFPVGDMQGYLNLKAYVHGFNPRSLRHALAALAERIVGAQRTSNFQNWPG